MALSNPIDKDGPVDRAFDPLPPSVLDDSVCDRFETIAARYGSRPATDDGEQRFTYSELAQLADRIASELRPIVRDGGKAVAILLEHEARYPAAMLGILRARCFYVPLDATFPVRRNATIIATALPSAIVSTRRLIAENAALLPPSIAVVDIDSVSLVGGLAEPRPRPEDLAYLIFTSGSTAAPKGVAFDHQNAVHDAMGNINAAHINCSDRLALFHSPSVAGAVRVIYSALLTGAALHLISPRNAHPETLSQELQKRQITATHMVPVLFRRILGAVTKRQVFDSVRYLHLAGDRVDWSDVEAFRRYFPAHASLLVAMGMTECATAHSQWFVPRDFLMDSPRVPIGRELPDRRVSLAAHESFADDSGDLGEIVVSSRYVARGYWSSVEGVIPFPPDPADPARRVVRTGDLGRRRPDGLLEHLGRTDHQVKVRGFRVHLGEVEASLLDGFGLAEAAVIARKSDDGDVTALIAYVVASSESKPVFGEAIRRALTVRLPHYMVPAAIYPLGHLPVLPSNKIDRVALAGLDRQAEKPRQMDPATVTVRTIIEVIEGVMDLEGVTASDSLSLLGCDSLQFAEIAAELEGFFGKKLPDGAFEFISIGEIARFMKKD